MVLSQRHSSIAHARADSPQIPLDISRIVGLAAAMALNIAALMLLLVPVSPPTAAPIKEDVTIFEPLEKKKEDPPPKPPELEVSRARTDAKTTPIRQQVAPTPPKADTTSDAPIVEKAEYSIPTETTGETTGEDISIPQTDPPQVASRLEYASAPAPAYPRDALMDGLQGTVYLKVLVDVDGKPLSVEIHRSSGHRKLDDAAKRQVLKRWKFKPAMHNGQAIQVYGIVPVDFSLSRQ
jgi:periplasmic protein TonB